MILAIFTILAALTTITISKPLNPPPTLLLPIKNVTKITRPLNRQGWPPAPWRMRLDDESLSIAFEHYGRQICDTEDISCEARVATGLERIGDIINARYVPGMGRVDYFVSDGAEGGTVLEFLFRQEMGVPKKVVEYLVQVLWGLMVVMYGAREVAYAELLRYGLVAATFELTVPDEGKERGNDGR